jgi:hypothetical protein
VIFMSEPNVAVLPTSAITVAEGFNPRSHFGESEIAQLAASLMATDGVVQPLAVHPTCPGGRVEVVHRASGEEQPDFLTPAWRTPPAL